MATGAEERLIVDIAGDEVIGGDPMKPATKRFAGLS
jgi:hypothetical protein